MAKRFQRCVMTSTIEILYGWLTQDWRPWLPPSPQKHKSLIKWKWLEATFPCHTHLYLRHHNDNPIRFFTHIEIDKWSVKAIICSNINRICLPSLSELLSFLLFIFSLPRFVHAYIYYIYWSRHFILGRFFFFVCCCFMLKFILSYLTNP